jgi:beta-phosphoglucomutase
MIEAVIFDFDGVIADTMADNCKAWQKSFAEYNFEVSSSEYYQLEGMGRYQIATHFIDKYKLDPSIIERVVEAKERYYKNNNTFKLFSGTEDIFNFLKQRAIPFAIVTGASKTRINEHMEKRYLNQLSALITADDVTHTKPDPEPYLKAIAHLNKISANCLVIENAILGIQSAKAAGCPCFALETTLPKEELFLADEVYPTHHDLLIRLQVMFSNFNAL